MILDLVIILAILFLAIKADRMFGIVSTITLMTLSILTEQIYPGFLSFTTTGMFAEEMLIFIVILVLGDAFILKIKALKENFVSIFILSCLFVVMAIFLGITGKELIFPDMDISTGALIALFAMVTATDPVSVISVFKQYKLPHKLETLAEGESLFNDAMALTMFSAFGLYMMKGGDVTIAYTTIVTLEVFVGSILIGFTIGMIGLALMKNTKDIMGEFVLILLVAYAAFFAAEHTPIVGGNHLSGLLSEIVAILTMTTIIDNSYERERKHAKKETEVLENIALNSIRYKVNSVKNVLSNLTTNLTDIKRQNDIASFLSVIGLLVNGVLFVSLAHIIQFDMLLKYWVEIIGVFLYTRLVRASLIAIFSALSYYTGHIKEMNIRWFAVLNFAGIQGGLSIVMLHMMNMAIPDFEHKVMFESIVTGVILLSTFTYVGALSLVIGKNKEKFIEELENEKH